MAVNLHAVARIAPDDTTVTSTTPAKRARKRSPIVVGRVACWNPHVAGALALAMRQGQTIRATYEGGTITLTTEDR